ncbi:MAG: BRO-N domain-containing protein [Waterburya sp.]
MNSLSVFARDDFSVRTINVDGQIAFCLADCLRAMRTKTTTTAAKALIEEELGDGYVKSIPIVDALGREQDTLFISEPALTFLLGRSRTEAGKKLNQWLHSEVLPSIRRSGKYELQKESLERQFQPDVSLKTIDEFATILGKRFGASYEQRVLQQNLKKFHHFLDMPVLEPEEKASVSSGERLLTPTQIASELGLNYKTGNPNPQAVNKLLESLGYQTKTDTGWSPTSKAIDAKLCDRKPIDTNSRSQKDQLMWNEKILIVLSEHISI